MGFVRALETFMQSITCNKKATKCSMSYLPITIAIVYKITNISILIFDLGSRLVY